MGAGPDLRRSARRDRVNGVTAAPPARHLRIAPTAQDQLSASLNWIDVAARGRLGREVIESAMSHQREVDCPPGILIAAAVQYLISDSDREPDFLNRFWTIANLVSARERARYLNMEEDALS